VSTNFSPASELNTIPRLLDRNAKTFAAEAANREKEYGIWQSWTWSEVQQEVHSLAMGLIELGLAEGDHVAIIGRNRPYLYWSMIAAQCAGAIPVPVYQDSVAEEMHYVLDHCGARFVIAEDQEQVDKVLEIQDRLPNLEQMVYLDPRGLRRYDHSKLSGYREVQRAGFENKAKLEPMMTERSDALNSESTAVMLYTSGTTGKPKGVVLSHGNIIFASQSSAEFDNLTHKDSVLAYLPMAWVGDFIFSIGQAYWTGFSYFFAPPRYFEGLLTQLMVRMEDSSGIKRRMFHYFLDHAKKVGPALMDGKSIGGFDRFKYWIGDKLIYGPIRNRMGMTHTRLGYTAGEAIGPEIFEFYRSLGINLKQLYGQTEASVYITIQPDGEVRADTVGIAAPGVDLKIAESGEVFYRSPGTFREYYKNPESTASTKDAEGWVATGDAGFIEEGSNHLRIIDRAKDVGKMADGSLFAPKYVENKLKFYPNILEAVLFGADRDRCVAFINIDLLAVGNWAERNNIAYSSYMELASHPQVLAQLAEHVAEVNKSVAQDLMLSGCQIHRFLVLHKELDADDGEITRTRKVRRKFVEDKYQVLVDALYAGDGEVFIESEVTYEDGRKGSISATLQICDADVVPVSTKMAAE